MRVNLIYFNDQATGHLEAPGGGWRLPS